MGPTFYSACRVHSPRSGFTLIELLVGMTVGILLVVILFQIFNVAAAAWQRGENQADAYREARAAMQLMTRDFSSICRQFPVNPASSPAPLPTDGGIAPTLVLEHYPQPEPPRQEEDFNNEEAYFLTTVPNSGLSSLCAVGYFCQWLPDVAKSPARAPRAYSLFRQFLGSGQATQPGLYELLKTAPSTPLTFMDVFVRSRPFADVAAGTGKIVSTPVEMASYIWDLQFRIDTNLKAERSKAQPPDDHGDLLTPPKLRKYTSKAGEEHPLELPPYVEIRFKALSAAGARQLEGNNAVFRKHWWPASAAVAQADPVYRTVIAPSSQQFVARVPLQNVRAGLVPSF